MFCSVLCLELPTINDIGVTVTELTAHALSPPQQFYHVKHEVSPAGPKRVIRRWGYGVYVICAAVLTWLLYTGWNQKTREFQLSNTRVDGYKCTMLRGYSGSQVVGSFPGCHYGSEARFDVYFEQATSSFDQCMQLMGEGMVADPASYVSCSCTYGLSGGNSSKSCSDCTAKLKEHSFCTIPWGNITALNLTSEDSSNSPSFANVTVSHNSPWCVNTFHLEVNGPPLQFAQLHGDAMGTATFKTTAAIEVAWYSEADCSILSNAYFRSDPAGFISRNMVLDRLCSTFTNAGPYLCEREVQKSIPDLLGTAFANTQALFAVLVILTSYYLTSTYGIEDLGLELLEDEDEVMDEEQEEIGERYDDDAAGLFEEEGEEEEEEESVDTYKDD